MKQPSRTLALLLVVSTILVGCGQDSDPVATAVHDEDSSPVVSAVLASSPDSTGVQSVQTSSRPKPDVTCSDDAPNQFQSNDEFLAEIPACVEIYIWPEEYYPDPQKIVDRNNVPEIGRVEIGVAQGMVGSLNSCSWLLTWLDAYKTGDTKRQSDALLVLTDGVPFYIDLDQRGYPDGHPPKYVEQAALGDPTEVQSMVTANCEPAYWVANP